MNSNYAQEAACPLSLWVSFLLRSGAVQILLNEERVIVLARKVLDLYPPSDGHIAGAAERTNMFLAIIADIADIRGVSGGSIMLLCFAPDNNPDGIQAVFSDLFVSG